MSSQFDPIAPKPHIAAMSAARAGSSQRPAWAENEELAAQALWLDRNESRDPQLAAVLQQALAEIPVSALFDYPKIAPVRQKLAAHLGVGSDQLVLAHGSDAALRGIFEAYVGSGDKVLLPTPTYIMSPVFCRLQEAVPVVIDYEATNHGPYLPPEKIIAAIRSHRPRLVYLPNPNSPTGTALEPDELRAIIEEAGARGSLILIDEAYHPFHPRTVLPWLAEYSHLIISRTMSKAWGMAGVRIGYTIASRSVTAELLKVRPLYEIGSISLVLLDRMLDRVDAMQESVARLTDGKRYFVDEMRSLGFAVLRGEGNFCLVNFGDRLDTVQKALVGIAGFRRVSHPSLAGYHRVTATTRALFEPIVARIREAAEVSP
jgi:histidinol-phosphate aminotransferase